MVVDFVVFTGVVVIANVAEVMLAGTVTVAGTVVTLLLALRVTVAPSAGAGLLRVTVPTACVPPWIEVGLKVSELSTGAVIVNFADFVVVL